MHEEGIGIRPLKLQVGDSVFCILLARVRIDGGVGGLTPQFPCSFFCDPPTPQPLSFCCVADPPSSFFPIRTLLLVIVLYIWTGGQGGLKIDPHP